MRSFEGEPQLLFDAAFVFLFVRFNNLIKPNVLLLPVTVCWRRLITLQIVLLVLQTRV